MNVLRLITIIILIVAITFIIVEAASEEVEIFGPLAAISLIAGCIMLFVADPQEWFGLDDQGFRMFTIAIIVVAAGLLIFTAVVFKSVHKLRDLPVENYQGKSATVVKPISEGQEGFVHFEGSKWKAYCVDSKEYEKDEKVIISGIDGLKLIVRKPNPDEL